jgi:hypothetical protein
MCNKNVLITLSSYLHPTYLDLPVVASSDGGQNQAVSLARPEPSDLLVAGYELAVGMP